MNAEIVVTAYLSLGSNIGDRLGTLVSALEALAEADEITLRDVSGVYETQPWGGVDQDPYFNLCVAIDTTLEPLDLLATCQAVEAAHGRNRDEEVRWGPRTLDVDVLLFGTATVDHPALSIPHPRLAERAFVLVPLMEVMPAGELPDGRRIAALVTALAPLEGIELALRLDGLPGQRIERPDGPPTQGAYTADEWADRRPNGAPDGVYR